MQPQHQRAALRCRCADDIADALPRRRFHAVIAHADTTALERCSERARGRLTAIAFGAIDLIDPRHRLGRIEDGFGDQIRFQQHAPREVQ